MEAAVAAVMETVITVAEKCDFEIHITSRKMQTKRSNEKKRIVLENITCSFTYIVV